MDMRHGKLSYVINGTKVKFENMDEFYNFDHFDDITCLSIIGRSDIDEIKKLPSKLEVLDCTESEITKLPQLPSTLKILNIVNSSISELPDLPDHLEELDLMDSQVSELPKVPPFLKSIDVSGLDVLGELPDSLKDINSYSLNELVEHGYLHDYPKHIKKRIYDLLSRKYKKLAEESSDEKSDKEELDDELDEDDELNEDD